MEIADVAPADALREEGLAGGLVGTLGQVGDGVAEHEDDWTSMVGRRAS